MKVICISGKAGCGKDTTAGIMYELLEQRGEHVLIAHYADLVKYVCTKFFGWNGEKDVPGRNLLQMVGTDIVRAQDENFWVKFVRDMLIFFGNQWDYVLIPDTRFPNEISVLCDAGFDVKHVRVIRSGYDSALTDDQMHHPSETAMDEVRADYYIYNLGSLAELRKAVAGLIKNFNAFSD